MNFIKKVGKTIWASKHLFFVFFFSLGILIVFSNTLFTYDSVWNYSFSYAIANGQIPFLDFNMVVPGFYAFLMSIGLRIFSNSSIIFFVEQALLVTIMFYFIYKMYGKIAWIFLLAMCTPLFVAFTQTYNFGILFLMVIVWYLEKNKKSDYLVGLVLGLMVLTKHTIGLFLLIPSVILYFNDYKKLLKRLCGLIFVGLIFVVYLIFTGSFVAFLDLCVFGLFDFAGNNTEIVPIYLVLSIILFIFNILYVIKNPKEIIGYYVLLGYSVMFPIFGHYHFYIYFVMMSFLVVSKIKLNENYIRNLSLVLILLLVVANVCVFWSPKKFIGMNNFELVYYSDFEINSFKEANDLYIKYKKIGNTRFLASTTVWLNITNNEKIDYFSILLTGNHGYDGSNKMIYRVKESKDMYYIINMKEYSRTKKYKEQFDDKVLDYIIDNSDLVESVGCYNVYYYD